MRALLGALFGPGMKDDVVQRALEIAMAQLAAAIANGVRPQPT